MSIYREGTSRALTTISARRTVSCTPMCCQIGEEGLLQGLCRPPRGVKLRAGRPRAHAGQLEPDPLDLLVLRSQRWRRLLGTPLCTVAPALGLRDDAQARVPLCEDAAVREAARDVDLRCLVPEVIGLCPLPRCLACRLVSRRRLALGGRAGHRRFLGRSRLAWRLVGHAAALGVVRRWEVEKLRANVRARPCALEPRLVVGLRGGQLGVKTADDDVPVVQLHTRRPSPRLALADPAVLRGAWPRVDCDGVAPLQGLRECAERRLGLLRLNPHVGVLRLNHLARSRHRAGLLRRGLVRVLDRLDQGGAGALDGLGGRARELAHEVVPDEGRARVTDRERLGRHELGQVGAVRVRDELEVERRLAAAVGRAGGRVERVVLLEEHQLDVSGARLPERPRQLHVGVRSDQDLPVSCALAQRDLVQHVLGLRVLLPGDGADLPRGRVGDRPKRRGRRRRRHGLG
mmetsp:Transcript_28079/g.71316  ORF Transcript_28079/g.71316 Transcript_28079/m.71316 type:complete len:460 (-) Transcript_28079:611-1990(-)